jgi:glycosyltransferase involved in cell wall biosynthesis
MSGQLVSVIIPCYNQGRYLAESIGSVLASGYAACEIVVVDDGSTDPDTCRILAALDYPRTRLIRRPNGGLAAARNSGITAANGTYILPLDADDRVGPAYLAQAVAAFESDDRLGIVYCRAEKFGAETGPWRLPAYRRWRMRLGNVIFCSALYRKADWATVGGYDEQLRRGWEDWDFWLSLLELGRRVRCLELTGFYYRKNPASMAAGMAAGLKTELHRRLMSKHARFFSGWSGWLSLLLPLYYRLASGRIYRRIKRGAGR